MFFARSCKKVQALVTSTKSPYKDGTFPSGTNWDDYIDWFKVEVVVAGGKEVTPTTATVMPQELLPEDTGANDDTGTYAIVVVPGDNVDDMILDEANENLLQQVAVGANAIVVVPGGNMDDMVLDEANEEVLQQAAVGVLPAACEAAVEEEEIPSTDIFKSFIAWCLWGFIHVEDNLEMRSRGFTDSKTDTGFGWKTGSRTALAVRTTKGGATGPSAVDDGRRGRKRKHKDTELLVDNDKNMLLLDKNVATTLQKSSSDIASVISQTLVFMDSQSAETQMKKIAELQVRVL